MTDAKAGRMVLGVERLLTLLIWLNLICLIAFVIVLAGTFVPQDAILRRAPGDGVTLAELAGVRAVLAIGIVVVPLAHVALTRLRAIVASVRLGDPFVAENARRLSLIAWTLLGIMICDLGFGVVAAQFDESLGWTFSLTGWLAVLLTFVLARVFDHGTRLRDELEGTV